MLLAASIGCSWPQPTPAPTSSPTSSPPSSPRATESPNANDPTVECEPSPDVENDTDGSGQLTLPATLTCENAIAAARQVVDPDAPITSIEFHYGAWCPPNARCAPVKPDPNVGFVIFYLRPSHDMWAVVPVSANENGEVIASEPSMFVSSIEYAQP